MTNLYGVLVGSTIGVAAAWFALPVRTVDVVRRRIADCVAAALTDDLRGKTGAARAAEALDRLDQLAPALRVHGRTIGRWRPAPIAPPLPALRELTAHAALVAGVDRRQLRRDVVRVRRAIVGQDDPAPDELAVAVGDCPHGTAVNRPAPDRQRPQLAAQLASAGTAAGPSPPAAGSRFSRPPAHRR